VVAVVVLYIVIIGHVVHSAKLKIDSGVLVAVVVVTSTTSLLSSQQSSVSIHKVEVTRLLTLRAKVEALALASVTTRLRMAKGKAGGVLVICGIEEAMAGL